MSQRGWTAYVEEGPATDMQAMPDPLMTAVTRFIVALALEVGAALDAGKRPPGQPMDDLGVRYSVAVYGEAVFFEYYIAQDIREIRVPTLIWVH